MDFPAQFQTLETRTAEALASVRSATSESRDQLRARIDQAQVDLDLASKDAKQKAGPVACLGVGYEVNRPCFVSQTCPPDQPEPAGSRACQARARREPH